MNLQVTQAPTQAPLNVVSSPTQPLLNVAKPKVEAPIPVAKPVVEKPIAVTKPQPQDIYSVGDAENQTSLEHLQWIQRVKDEVQKAQSEYGSGQGGLDDDQILKQIIDQNDSIKFDTSKAVGTALSHNNPYGIKFRGQPGATEGSSGFATFATADAAHQAYQSLLKKRVQQGQTLGQYISMYAPPSENDTAKYIQQAVDALGVSADTPLSQIDANKLEAWQAQKETGTKIVSGSNRTDPERPKTISEFKRALADGLPANEVLSQFILQNTHSDANSPTSNSNSPEDPGVIDQLNKRASDISGAISNTFKGKINPVSGLVQTAGGLAGSLNDVASKALELVPGVKTIEKIIGSGIGALAQTAPGQSILSSVQEFNQQYPELSADIGAGFNILTALPVLRGISAIKDVVLDASSSALKSVAEKAAVKDLSEVVSRTVGGRNAIQSIPKALDTLIKERALPTITSEGGIARYSTKEAGEILNNTISNIDQKELQPILEQISAKQNFGQKLSNLKRIAIQEVKNDPTLREAGVVPQALKQIENRFTGWKYSYGDSVDLATENRLKIGSGKFTDWGTAEGSADKAIYRALQKNIENVASKNGYEDVINLTNKKMQSLIRAEQMLQYIDGKTLKNKGLLHGIIKNVSTGLGEAAGNSVGVPVAGAFVGRGVGGLAEKSLGKLAPRTITNSILERTSPNAVKKAIKGKLGGLIGANLAHKSISK